MSSQHWLATWEFEVRRRLTAALTALTGSPPATSVEPGRGREPSASTAHDLELLAALGEATAALAERVDALEAAPGEATARTRSKAA